MKVGKKIEKNTLINYSHRQTHQIANFSHKPSHALKVVVKYFRQMQHFIAMFK